MGNSENNTANSELRENVSRLMPSETGMYLSWKIDPESVEYCLDVLLDLSGTDKASVGKAAEKVMLSHDALHSYYGEEDGTFVRILTGEVPKIDWKNAESYEDAKRCVEADRRPFDLSKVPVRLTGYEISEDHLVLHMAIHHIAFDGGSLHTFKEEFFAALNGNEIKTKKPDLTSLSLEKLDEEHKAELDYFRSIYEDGLPTCELPIKDKRPDIHPADDGLLTIEFTSDEIKMIKETAVKNQVSVYELIFAAVSMTVGWYSSCEDLVLGVPFNTRSEGARDAIGMFVNELPVRIKPAMDKGLGDYLREVSEAIHGVKDNSNIPFSELVTEFYKERDLSRNPFFEVTLNDRRLEEPANDGKWKAELLLEPMQRDLLLNLFRGDGRMCLSAQYPTEFFDTSFIENLMEQIKHTLSLIAQSSDHALLSDVLLLPGRQISVLESFHGDTVPYDDSETVISLFKKAASEYPDNTALIFKEKSFSYKEIDEISDRVAGAAIKAGLKKGDVVSILIPRCQAMVTASLGALKGGCAYQPLDPSYPPERLNFMVKDSSAKMLITTEELRPLITEFEGAVLLLSDIPSLPLPDEKPDAGIEPADTFILLYTSGSTGTPKGVKLTHGNLVCFINFYHRLYELHAEDRVGAYASYGFDACMMDMYPALTKGAAVTIIPEEIRLDLERINDYLERNHVTHLFMTTQVGRQFAAEIESTCLKYLSVGGEKLAPFNFAKNPPSYRFFNAYGPTECTIFSTIYEIKEREENYPIGRGLDNLKVYVVDKNGHRVPPGVLGELWIAGPQVGNGYLNRPEKTAEVFVDNPFDKSAPHAYRTGDIVRFLFDGKIDFVGRRDGQVKIRGFRIELTEVETVIRDFPDVKDVTVADFDDPSGSGKFIAAYVVMKNNKTLDVAALNEFIRLRKPPYMIPAFTMQLDSIPLNQNQKVNKRALPKPELTQVKKSEQGAAAPLNLLEKEIKEIISEVIGTDDIGITDDLGSLGLTSISSIRLATKIFKRFNVSLEVRELISEGSIQVIENEILKKLLSDDNKAEDAEKTENSVSDTGKNEIKKSCRLTFAQQGVYADCIADPTITRYNIPFELTVPNGISTELLKNAVLSVCSKHPGVFSRFVSGEDNEIRQEELTGFIPEIPVKEMSGDDYAEYKKTFVRPFDLEKGPCARFEIIKTGETKLLCDMHHLISDGASVDIFVRDLCSAIDGKDIEPEFLDYYGYAENESISKEAEEFFKDVMSNAEDATELISDVFEKDLPHKEASVELETDIKKVREFSQRHSVTPAALYLSALYITLSRYVCEDTVSIATISNGRSDVRINSTIGMFVNTLPLVSSIDNEESCESFLHRTAKAFSDTITHENYPFARTASLYDFRPSVSFAYQIGVVADHSTKYGKLSLAYLETAGVKLPVGIYINGTGDKAVLSAVYDSAMYTEAMMRSLLKSFENAVLGLMSCGTLKDISLTGKDEWAVLDSYNKPWDLGFDKNDTAVSVFKRTASLTPDKTAAVYYDKSYTYKELDELTDRLAAVIYKKACEVTGKTVLSEEVAALLLSRNENVFILPLAVLKAGMAYEPLDPSYPPERLNFMVKDAGACLLICEKELRELLNEYSGASVTTDELYAAPSEPVNIEPPKPSDMFIILYTSGSTGTPKGCQIEHKNLVAYAYGVRNDFYTHDDRIAAFASFGFDVNMSDIFCTLLNGGTVYLIPEDIRMNLDALAKYFDEVGITALLLTTQVGVQFLQNYPKMRTLRMLVMGGEKLPAVDPKSLSYTIVNGYGPTENCCGVSLFPIREYEPNIPIGRPMATIHAFVLDKTGHRLPAGAAGEFILSGPQVSRGYLNRPDKTAEAYSDCPFNDFRMYHTGDIVRYRENGDVEFVGRKDGQVKIRGFRIETREVESVIRSFEGVKDATVQAYDYEGGGKYLAAFVVSDNELDIEALKDFIKEQKPAYMVPAAIMQLEKIPLTVNQKVDKKALPKPEIKKAEYVAPEGKTEKDICTIFEHILELEKVGAQDDFFEIGGSSILAMKVVIMAEKTGYSIVYNDVFKYTTPAALARFIDGESGEDKAKNGTSPAQTAGSDNYSFVGPDGYDYSAINEMLSKNTPKAFRDGKLQEINDVLLPGATGYLGIHVLYELINNYSGKIYCVVRTKSDESGEERLKKQLQYYFGKDFGELFGTRLFVVEADVATPGSLDDFTPESKDITVINCAASVKHFARNHEIEKTNLGSVENLIGWCREHNARLVHISTGSVIGGRKDGRPAPGTVFDEHVLYIGQYTENNEYTNSKFMAEKRVYEEIINSGLSAKVMRMGNLAPRFSDGKFQINYTSNNSMNTLKAFQVLGMAGFDQLNSEIEYSPIDVVAQAVLRLSETPKECVCFIPVNPYRVLLMDVIEEMRNAGFDIKGVEADEFSAALQEGMLDEKNGSALSPLMAYNNNDGIIPLGLDDANTGYTVNMLYRLGFTWPETGKEYVRKFINELKKLDFFEK